MMDFFLNWICVERYPPAIEYLILINDISTKTQLPNPTAFRDVLRLFEILGSLCIQEDMKRNLYEWRLENSFERNMKFYQSLDQYLDKDRSSDIVGACKPYEHVFPTHLNRFIGLKSSSHLPIVVFNKDLAKVFLKKDNVDFIFVDDIIRSLEKFNEQSTYRFKKRIDGELLKIMFFFKTCSFPTLTDLYQPPDIAPGQISTGCYVWEKHLHEEVSYLQQYIYQKHNDHYRNLQAIGFAQYIKKSFFFTTPGFEVVYRLKNHDKATVSCTKVAHVEHNIEETGMKANVYIIKDHEEDGDNADDIKLEMAKLFVPNNNVEITEDIHDFWCTLMIEGNVEKLMRRRKIDPLPISEERWEYPKPKDPFKPKVKDEIVEEDDDEEMPDANQRPPPTGERPMTCWPPRNPGGSGHVPKPDSVKKAEEALLEKWKLPDGPASSNTTDTSTENGVNDVRRNIPSQQQNLNENRPKKEDESKAATPSQPGYTTAPPSVQRQSQTDSSSFANNQQSTNPNTKQQNNFGKPREHIPSENSEIKGEPHHSNVSQQASNADHNSAPPSSKIDKPHSENATGFHQTIAPSTPNRARNNTLAEGGSQKNTPTKFNVDQLPSYTLASQYNNIAFKLSDDLERRVFQPSFGKSGKPEEMITLIGKIGEEIVYSYFCNLYKEALEAQSVEIHWLNEAEETGQPYDLRIKHLESGIEDLFVEVKTTVAEEEREFEISSQQLKFAFETGEQFHLYRVSGLATQSDFRLKCLPNLASHMDKKAVKTYMIL